MSRYVEFPVSRWWAKAQLARGRKPLCMLMVAPGTDVEVRLLAVPDEGPVPVKLQTGYEAYVPIASLRRVSNPHGDTPPEHSARMPTPPGPAPEPIEFPSPPPWRY